MSSAAASAETSARTFQDVNGKISLPAGIKSFQKWGETVIVFGRDKGLSYAEFFEDVNDKGYIAWMRTQPAPSSDFDDLLKFADAQDILNGSYAPIYFPGTFKPRQFKTADERISEKKQVVNNPRDCEDD